MPGIRRLAIMLVCWLVLSQATRADFQWIGYWHGNVLGPTDTLGSVTASAQAVANSSITGQDSLITFREFRILDLPPGGTASLGWNVHIFGSYAKLLSGHNGSVRASMAVDSLGSSAFAVGPDFTQQTGGFLVSFTDVLSASGGASLPEGVYTLSGTFDVSAATIFALFPPL